jgi:transcription elongation GreA/GreB family factor
MKAKRMKKYTIVYEAEIEAKNIKEAEELGDLEETRDKAKLKRIEGENDSWERFYDIDD